MSEELGKTIEEFKVNDSASITKDITAEKLAAFADVIDDHDPIHTDPEYAKTTIYGKCIAHGVYLDCMISGMLSELVSGGIDAKLSIKYTAPVFAGDTITATGTVKEIKTDRNRLFIDTKCVNQNGETVAVGDAVCLARTDD
ncbi:enoyl-CoA hydratase [Pseudodesulfovibrio sp. JC047]|uniref:MaoC family dehydratase n=1 Tax=Pseudodesulfovibrio sp. JC047 TaxID=2683199 RepID=UPI0013D11226|nr:MaoC family dehydratase [Pseudodesulfovibrio sp. JC047]NDV18801.1 enoyl-CoA hydratase [Pseudodesulfovibrio sp. JC047]